MFENILYSAFNFLAQQPGIPVSSEPVVPAASSASASPSFSVIFSIVCFIYGIICILLILLVMLQTSKAEGLAGIMGGSVQNMFKGKESKETREEVFKKWTNVLCVSFVVLSFILSLWLTKILG